GTHLNPASQWTLIALSRLPDPMSDLPQSAVSGVRKERVPIAWLRSVWQGFAAESPHEFLVLCVVTGFLLLYGLVPLVGGDQLGLVGADEPRYAQIASEMLAQHNQVCNQLDANIVPRSLSARAIENSWHC